MAFSRPGVHTLCNKILLFAVILLGFVASFSASNVPTSPTLKEESGSNNNNPIIFAEDGYEWPTLYDEADDMLDVAMSIYPFAQLRKLAKNNPTKFDDPAAVLKEPITAAEILAVLGENIDFIKESVGEDTSDAIEDATAAIVQRQRDPSRKASKATLLQFGDDNNQEELVYAIAVDRAMKRITVIFRGSVTKQDFIHDAQIWLTDTDNPYFKEGKGQSKNIGIHSGFYDYLFYDDEAEEKRDDGSIKCKYEIILDQVVKVFKEYPGYKLYVTGHSLGAALSSLFAFEASARDDIPNPVTCVSIASPYVGDERFHKAFQFAESMGRIRYLRVANKKDIVAILPFLSLRLRAYKHCGIELKLHKGKTRASLRYTKYGARYLLNTVKRVWGNSLLSNLTYKYLTNHGCSEYDDRLEKARPELEGLYLNDLYHDQKVVGLLPKANQKKKQKKVADAAK